MSSRASMAAELALGGTTPTKTFVVEAHADNPGHYLADLVGASNVEPTDDVYLHKLWTAHGQFWVDHLNERFWLFHTDMRTDRASGLINGWVGTRHDLDWMWLPSEHLRRVWPGAKTRQAKTEFSSHELLGDAGADTEDVSFRLSGRNAEPWLEFLLASLLRSAVSFDGVELELTEPSYGYVREALNRRGKFLVSGDSFALHTQFVGAVVDRYKALVDVCERKAIRYEGWQSDDGGGTFEGGPLTIQFSRPIIDREAFVDTLFSSRAPFRLWGLCTETNEDMTEVEAVDLHVGKRVVFDIGNDWMRVYLQEGGCGNTIARLVCNLQHRFDAALVLVDADVNAAVNRS